MKHEPLLLPSPLHIFIPLLFPPPCVQTEYVEECLKDAVEIIIQGENKLGNGRDKLITFPMFLYLKIFAPPPPFLE